MIAAPRPSIFGILSVQVTLQNFILELKNPSALWLLMTIVILTIRMYCADSKLLHFDLKPLMLRTLTQPLLESFVLLLV